MKLTPMTDEERAVFDREREYLRSVYDEVGALVVSTATPIVSFKHAGKSGPPVVAGSGVLLAVDDARFLVTAAHVLRMKIDHDVPLYLPGPNGGREAHGACTMPNEHDRNDIGVLRLADECVADLVAQGAVFARSAHTRFIDPQAPPPGGFIVCGFPDAGSEPLDALVKPVGYMLWTTHYRGSRDDLGSYDAQRHLLLHLDRAATHNEITGEELPFPEPLGMSGCGVWSVSSARDANGQRCAPHQARLVGVQSSYYRAANALKAVTITAALALIANGWPELRPAIAIAGPPSTRGA